MAIAYTEASQSFMVDSRLKTTAFICFFSAILEIPSLTLLIFHMVAALKLSLNLMIFIRIPLVIVSFVFSIYILLQLERLLVERYHLDNIRIMIKSLIIMYIISPCNYNCEYIDVSLKCFTIKPGFCSRDCREV